MDQEMARTHEIRPVFGHTLPDPIVSGRVDPLIDPEKLWLRNAPEKLVGPEDQHLIHQVGHPFPVSLDQDHSAYVLALCPTPPAGLGFGREEFN